MLCKQKQSFRYVLQKTCSEKLRKIRKKLPTLEEFLFNNVASLQPKTLLKRYSQVLSNGFCEIFQNRHFQITSKNSFKGIFYKKPTLIKVPQNSLSTKKHKTKRSRTRQNLEDVPWKTSDWNYFSILFRYIFNQKDVLK